MTQLRSADSRVSTPCFPSFRSTQPLDLLLSHATAGFCLGSSWEDVPHTAPAPPSNSRPASKGRLLRRERSHIGLSGATRRENRRKERLQTQIDQRFAVVDGKGGLGETVGNAVLASNCGGMGSSSEPLLGMLKPQDFQAELKSLSQTIDELSRKVGFDESGESKAQERARQARIERDAELRLARQEEAAARDPHRKVALRLENKRRFCTDQDPVFARVPMTTYGVAGGKGPEKVPLVDVRMLRSRCLMLDEGHNVPAMLDVLRRQDGPDRASGRCQSAPVLNPNQDLGATLLPKNVDERRKQVKLQHEVQHANTIIRKLAKSRNKSVFGGLPFQFAVSENSAGISPASVPGRHQVTIVSGAGNKRHSHRESVLTQALSQKFVDVLEDTPQKRPPPAPKRLPPSPLAITNTVQEADISPSSPSAEMLASLVGDSMKRCPRGIDARHAVKLVSLSSERAKAAVMNREARKRACAKWFRVRVVVKVLMLLLLNRRRHRCIVPVIGMLSGFGEWVRMRRAIFRFSNSVKTMQRCCRSFLETKKARCQLLVKEWQRVEDFYLTAYFRLYSQEIIMEMKDYAVQDGILEPIRVGADAQRKPRFSALKARQPASRQQAELLAMLEQGVESGELQVEWRAYRIPPADRLAAIGEYYSVKLKNHARANNFFHDAVHRAVAQHKDMIEFLKFFGATPEQASTGPHLAARPISNNSNSFWRFREDEFLMLMAFCAHNLANTSPYKDHPANKDRATSTKAESGTETAGSIAALFKNSEKKTCIPLGRLKRLVDVAP